MDFATSLSGRSGNMPTEIPLFENPNEEAFDGELGMEGDDFTATPASTTPPKDTTMERAIERAAEKKKPVAAPSGYMRTKVVVDQVRSYTPAVRGCVRTSGCWLLLLAAASWLLAVSKDQRGQLSRYV